MTGTHWIDESGYLEEPVVLTDTLDVGRADDGVVELDDRAPPGRSGAATTFRCPSSPNATTGFLNDIQARAVSPTTCRGFSMPPGPGNSRAAASAPAPG